MSFSISLAIGDSHATGLYDFPRSLSLHGFRMGMIHDTFHKLGITSVLIQRLRRLISSLMHLLGCFPVPPCRFFGEKFVLLCVRYLGEESCQGVLPVVR